MRYIFLFALLWVFHPSSSQNSKGTAIDVQKEAFGLFQSGQYESVVKLLKNKKDNTISDSYLLEMSLLKLGSDQTEPLAKLVSDNPKNPFNSQANYTLGKYFFHKKNARGAGKFLGGVDVSRLTGEDRNDYYFMRGYLALQVNDFKRASGYFDRSAKSGNSDPGLTYYRGYTAYYLNQKEKAVQLFDGVKNHPEFGTSASFFSAKMKLEDGEYDQVISDAQSELTEEVSETNSAFYQVIGEAWALKNQADKASVYFERAIELHPGNASAALYYQAGVTNFKLGLNEKAIEYLTEAGIRSGEYAHLSAFQLGRLYVSSNEPEKALSAYVEASASSDREIREEAVFKSGKLQVNQKNYPEGIKYLRDYLSEFPGGNWKPEAQQILAEAYLRTSDYDQAITHLKEVGISATPQKKVYQKVTFLKAQLRFNDAMFQEAVKWFRESLQYPEDQELENMSYFLIGESFFNLGDFQQAAANYQKQRYPTGDTYYGLGYAYYNQQQYDQASGFFEKLLNTNTRRAIKSDGEIRLADCYYATKQYQKALTQYESASEKNLPYVVYQKGLVKKNLKDFDGAAALFERIVSSGDKTLRDDAMYQLGQLNFERAEFEKAEFHFGRLISEYSSGRYLAEARLNRAVSRTNLGKLDEAGQDYEYILDNYIRSTIAFNAILGLQELQTKGVKVKDIESSIARYRQANPDDKSLEVVEFEFAKSQYFNLEYDQATGLFEKFISDYTESSYLSQARYYLADAHYRQDNLEEARENFELIKSVKSELTGRILARLGDIYYSLSDYESAVNIFQELIALNLSPKDTYNGRLGLMNSQVADSSYAKSIEVADEIIAAEWKPLNGERNAVLTKAKSYLALGDTANAMNNFRAVASNTDLISAESSYYQALIAFNKGEYQESIDMLFEFNSKFGSYSSWIDRSYLLIAENYIEKEELFQAKATLRSIIQHSEDENARQTAQERLSTIENLATEDSVKN